MKEPLILPDGVGPPIIHTEKVYVPVKEHPEVSSSSYYLQYGHKSVLGPLKSQLKNIFDVHSYPPYLNSVEVISETTANEVKSGVKLLITTFLRKVQQSGYILLLFFLGKIPFLV